MFLVSFKFSTRPERTAEERTETMYTGEEKMAVRLTSQA